MLSNGEKVSPGDMESAILLDPLFEQVMIVGEGKPYLSALVVLNEEHWRTFAAGLHVDPTQSETLRDPKVVKALTKHVAHQLKHFPGYAQIRRLHLELKPWTVDEGLLTPTLKGQTQPGARPLPRGGRDPLCRFRALMIPNTQGRTTCRFVLTVWPQV